MKRLFCLVICFGLVGPTLSASASASIKWSDSLRQKAEWYGSDEAVRIADNVLLYQRDTGGWPKNIDMAVVLTETAKAALIKQKSEDDSLIDNGATYTQLTYLGRVYNGRKLERHKEAFLKGMDYLFKAQYENGGWPQYYPRLTDYYKHITFNDDAMVGVMNLLREVARKNPVYAFVDEERRVSADKAVAKGIDCILRSQVKVNGKRTVWCAQHDEITLEPAPARTYEKISLSGHESVGIVRFLMGIDRPDESVIEAIQAAISWFDQVKLTGIKLIEKPEPSSPRGYERVVIQDAGAAPLWARFYEIGTNRPIFCGRDGVIKYKLADIEYERRNGYRWYVNTPARLLDQDYPGWLKKWRLKREVRQTLVSPTNFSKSDKL